MEQRAGFFERVGRGWHVAMKGWKFILENPSCLIFPLVSGITKVLFVLLVLFSYILYAVMHLLKFAQTNPQASKQVMNVELKHMIPPLSGTILTLLFFFVCILISSIMYTALSFYMAKKLEGQPTSIGASLYRGFSRIGSLSVWSLINAILALILKVIRKFARGNKFPFNLIVQFIAGAFKFAWRVLTFFVMPIFALKDLGAIATIEESGSTMKKMWGESIGANFNIGIVGLLAFLLLGFLSWAPLYLVSGASFEHHPRLIMFYAIGLIIAGMLVSLWISTATTLFQTATYLHSQGKSTGPFQKQFIETSFATHPSK